MKNLVTLIIFSALLFAGFGWVNGSVTEYFHFQTSGTAIAQNWLTLLILAVATLLGLVCGSLFDRLRKHEGDEIEWRDLVWKTFRYKKTIMAILVAPIIYFSVLKLVGSHVDDISDVLLAFQNAFFWESVFATVAGDHSRRPQQHSEISAAAPSQQA